MIIHGIIFAAPGFQIYVRISTCFTPLNTQNMPYSKLQLTKINAFTVICQCCNNIGPIVNKAKIVNLQRLINCEVTNI